MVYRLNAKVLLENLSLALAEPLKRFSEKSGQRASGIYFIYNKNNKIVYLGITGRKGRDRLSELTTDFRSHTLNRKLCLAHFNRKYNLLLKTFPNDIKEVLISERRLTRGQFEAGQKSVNKNIFQNYKYSFFEIEDERKSHIQP